MTASSPPRCRVQRSLSIIPSIRRFISVIPLLRVESNGICAGNLNEDSCPVTGPDETGKKGTYLHKDTRSQSRVQVFAIVGKSVTARFLGPWSCFIHLFRAHRGILLERFIQHSQHSRFSRAGIEAATRDSSPIDTRQLDTISSSFSYYNLHRDRLQCTLNKSPNRSGTSYTVERKHVSGVDSPNHFLFNPDETRERRMDSFWNKIQDNRPRRFTVSKFEFRSRNCSFVFGKKNRIFV